MQSDMTNNHTAAPSNDSLIALLFALGPQCYALPLADVREVVRVSALLTLAGAPPTLCGLLNLRGQHVPVLDGCVLMGLPAAYDLNSQIIIIGRDQPQIGLLVPAVETVEALLCDRDMSHGHAAAFIHAVAHRGDTSVVVLNADVLATCDIEMADAPSHP
jgi:purine-binding chemotaxis protein CheW